MARNVRTVIDVIDDLTGEIDAAAEKVEFAYRGTAYEIDLGPASAARLDEAMAPFIQVARKVKKTSKKAPAKTTPAQAEESARIREWARRNGHNVAPVGRVDRAIVAAYHEAHRSPAEPGLEAREAS